MEKSRNTQGPEEKLKNWEFFYSKQKSEEVHEHSLIMEGNNLYFMPMLDRKETLHYKSASRKTEVKC